MGDRSSTELDIIVASSNVGKVRELADIFAARGGDIVHLAAAPRSLDVEETGGTYRANAFLKASRYALEYNSPALGDDSGLAVDALNGRPGLYSARFGGRGLDDAGRTALLLEQLSDVPAGGRTARFVCALCLVCPDGRRVEAMGLVRGVITTSPRGGGGFGYDPVFLVPALGKTMAELDPAAKHRISHRGRAVANLLARLQRP